MNSPINIDLGTLVVLSGLSGAGKTRLRSAAVGLPEGAWVSMDDLRAQVLGVLPTLRGDRLQREIRQDANEAIAHITRTILTTRMQHGLTTVIDATNPTDADRQTWIDIAEQFGVPSQVLIVGTPLEQCVKNMLLREDWVPEARIREMFQPTAPAPSKEQAAAAARNGKTIELTAPQGFMLTSQYPYTVIDNNAVLKFKPREVPTDKLDVVSDVHGLLADVLALLAQAQWTLDENGVLRHPDPERRVLFLGDLVDRGPHSLEILEIVRKSCRAGTALCILGNHEHKLVKFIDQAKRDGIERWGSYANAETGMKLLKMSAPARDVLVDFMRRLPPYYTSEAHNVAFVHGDIHRFDPALSLKGDLVYGQSGYGAKVDSDALYERGVEAGLNTYFVIRGHIPQTSPQDNILSLELHGYQQGELRLLRFDDFTQALRRGIPPQEAAADATLSRKCEFDFDAYSAKQFELIKAMEDLTSRKLVRRYLDPMKMLRGYKYSKEVFWNASWGESDWLLKARGIVLDVGGNIVSNPFDKVFNYGERDTAVNVPDDTPVVEVLKLNGFLGIISPHPLKPGDILAHTQGSLDPQGPFSLFLTSFLDAKQKGLLARFFASRPMTLMFEVLHPEDPHIVEYDQTMHGLHLIGARGLGREDLELPEEELDAIAAELGFRRPWWKRTTFGAVKQRIRTCRDEGSMVREDTPEQRCFVKMKSPYYLTTKFLARLSENRAKHLFANPHNFKKHEDEELYPVIDAVTTQLTFESYFALTEHERVTKVREIVEGTL